MGNFLRDYGNYIENPWAVNPDAHGVGDNEHAEVDTNRANGVRLLYNVADVGASGTILLKVQDSEGLSGDVSAATQTVGTGLDDLTPSGQYVGATAATYTIICDSVLSATGVGAATQSVGAGLDDATSGGTYTGVTDSTITVTCDSALSATGVGTATQSVGSGLDDASSGGTYTGITDSTYTLTCTAVQGTGGTGSDDDWAQTTGAGLDDATIEGTSFTGTTADVYVVTISDAAASPDEFDWTVNGGGGATGVAITGAAQTLSQGVEIKFAATDGHTLGDAWTLNCSPDTFKYDKDGGAEVTGVLMTGGAQNLAPVAEGDEGVDVTFAATLGHTVNDAWTIAASPDTFKWSIDGGAETTDVEMTGAAQTLTDGVTVTFAATVGHTPTDAWTIAASPDTFSWEKDAEGATADVEMTGAAQLLDEGVSVTFAATVGHDSGDTWTFTTGTDAFADVTGLTTGVLSSTGEGEIDCYNKCRRYVRVRSTVANNAVDAAAVWAIYDNKLSPNPK